MNPLLHVGMVMAMSATTPEIETLLRAAEERLFLAIRTKDLASLGQELAEDFVHSAPGSPDQPRDAFLAAIRDMPYDIRELKGEDLRVRVLGDVALVSGIQRARVALADGTLVSAGTAFVDVFQKSGGRWRLRHAVSVELADTKQP